jgi:hypothetical protein
MNKEIESEGRYMARRKFYVPKDEIIRTYDEYRDLLENRDNAITLDEDEN